jgi:hypothetical protein
MRNSPLIEKSCRLVYPNLMLSRPFSRKSELARQGGGAALSGLLQSPAKLVQLQSLSLSKNHPVGPVIRLTDFDCSESMVAAAEARLGVRFSTVFRQYLLELAKSPSDLFQENGLAKPRRV